MDDFGFWDVIASMFWFMLLFAWIWLFIAILSDVFRDKTLGGGAKAMWCLFLIFLPWLGALVYLIARGGSMADRSMQAAADNEARMQAYIRETAGSGGGGKSVADEMKDLAALRDSGGITPEEYEQAKAKVLS